MQVGMWLGMGLSHAELLNTHLLPGEAKARSALLTLQRNADSVVRSCSFRMWVRPHPASTRPWLSSLPPPCSSLGCFLKDSTSRRTPIWPNSFLRPLHTGVTACISVLSPMWAGPSSLMQRGEPRPLIPFGGGTSSAEPDIWEALPLATVLFSCSCSSGPAMRGPWSPGRAFCLPPPASKDKTSLAGWLRG